MGWLGMQQCYSVASAQRRSRTTDGGLAQGSGEDGQQSVMHLENGVPVYQDMGMNMQVQPPALFSSTCAKHMHDAVLPLKVQTSWLCRAKCMYICVLCLTAHEAPVKAWQHSDRAC